MLCTIFLPSVYYIDDQFMIDPFSRKLQTIYIRLFTLFTYLKTKESYDRWVTRRLWEFRHKISKEKYLKISQNIVGKYQEASRAHSSNMQNSCSPIRIGGYQMIRIRPSEEVKTPPLPSGVRIPNVNICGGGKCAAAGCKNGGAHPIRVECCPTETIVSYPDMLSGCPPMVYPDALSGYTPCMDSKELSSISDLLW